MAGRKAGRKRINNQTTSPKQEDTIIYLGKILFRPHDWIYDPFLWINDIFGDNIKEYAFRQGIDIQTATGLSRQQESGFKELQTLIVSRLKNVAGQELTEKEKQYLKKLGLSIMAGKGNGKDFFTAIAIWYFQMCFENSRIMCTAMTDTQLKHVLWSELDLIASLAKKVDPENPASPTILQYMFVKNSERIFLNPLLEGKKQKDAYWGAEATTTNVKKTGEEQASALSGRHAENMLIVLDEPCAMPKAMFRPLESTLTQTMNLMLMIFNPIRRTGYAIESQYEDSERWAALRWNAEESEIITNKEQHKSLEKKYGRDSNPFRIDVLGLPPLLSGSLLFDADKIQDAIDREVIINEDDPIEKSVDCGAGGDNSVISTKRGGQIYPLKRKSTNDPNILTDWILGDYYASEADVLVSDNISIGWGIAGNLRKELKYKYRSVDARAKASQETRFANKRTEMFWNLKMALDFISLPNDKNLIDALSVIELDEPDKQGRMILKNKKQMRTDSGVYMDEADAVAQHFAFPTVIKHKDEEDYENDYGEGEDDYDSVAHGSQFSYVGR